MPIYHNRVDPYDGAETHYECVGCGHRFDSTGAPAGCPECDAMELRNISVPQE
jgi:rubrerythrin